MALGFQGTKQTCPCCRTNVAQGFFIAPIADILPETNPKIPGRIQGQETRRICRTCGYVMDLPADSPVNAPARDFTRLRKEAEETRDRLRDLLRTTGGDLKDVPDSGEPESNANPPVPEKNKGGRPPKNPVQ